MSSFELAQVNIALPLAPPDSPLLADFMNALDYVNGLAEKSSGFVWRLQSEEGNATAFRPYGDDTLINLSVWKDVNALNNFVYKNPEHIAYMKRRREWFTHMKEAYMVLWWVPQGHRPTQAEAVARLAVLRAKGPTPNAFTFKQAFGAPDAKHPGNPFVFGDICPA